MQDYKFISKDIRLNFSTRLHAYLAAIHDNRAMRKQFVNDLHLEKLEQSDIGFHLPKSYPIATNEINRIYQVRDKIVLREHRKAYAPKQSKIDDLLNEKETEHESLKNNRIAEQKELDELRAKLKNSKQSDDYIALESRVHKATAKVKNTDAAIAACKNEITHLKETKNDNLVDWNNQIKSIEKTIEMGVGSYVKRSTRHIESDYGFTEFTHIINRYDEETIKKVKGEYKK